jgi:O-antigen/teichoic acid export membrane protein
MAYGAIIRNLGSGAAARILSAALSLALLVLMAHIWRPSDFGIYLAGFNLFQLLQLTPLLGLHFLLARNAAATGVDSSKRSSATSESRDLATAAALGVAVAAATALVLGLGIARALPVEERPILPLVGLSLVPTAAITVVEMALTGWERLWLVAVVNIAESAARCVLFGVLIAVGAGAAQVFLGFCVLRCGALIMYLRDPACLAALSLRNFDFVVLRGLLREAPVLFPLMLLAAIFSRLDVALLSWAVSPEALASYAVAARCYDLVLMVPSVLVTVLLPVLARVDRADEGGDSGRLDALLGLLLRYGLLIGILCASAGALLAGPLLSGMFGPRYNDATLPLQLLLFAAVATGVNQLVACVLLVRNQQRLDLLCLAGGVVVLIPALLIAINLVGPWGAGLAVLLATLAQSVMRVAVLQWGGGVRVSSRDFVPPLMAMAAMLGVAWLGRGAALGTAPLAFSAFALVAWMAGSVRVADYAVGRALVTTP